MQFLANWGRESFACASQALKKIGARQKADIIDRCQAIVDEHFDCEGKSRGELGALLPNAVIDCQGQTTKPAGSTLPEAVVARILDLSYEYMACSEDVAELGLTYYSPHLGDIVLRVNEARRKRQREAAAFQKELRAADQVH